jgi:hypothetical protein
MSADLNGCVDERAECHLLIANTLNSPFNMKSTLPELKFLH